VIRPSTADHGQQEQPQRHGDHACGGGLERNTGRTENDAHNRRGEGGGVEASGPHALPMAQNRAIQRVAHVAGNHTHVQDVGPECEQPAILKDEALDNQDRRHHQRACVRAEHDGQQNPPAEVSARARHEGQREVDHLGGEYERTEDTHQGDPGRIQAASGLPARHAEQTGRPRPGSAIRWPYASRALTVLPATTSRF